MSVEIEWNGHYVYKKYTGNVTPQELKMKDAKILSDIRFASLAFIISDFLAVSDIDFSTDEIITHTKLHGIPSIYNPQLKVLLVADKASIRKKLVFYIENMQSTEWEIKLFKTMEEAYRFMQLK
ncbi:MAG: hypothetical protein JW857_09835 [Bacteroidales bacterium]|nr:hypothetical protein [Bacteroidales bacterium]